MPTGKLNEVEEKVVLIEVTPEELKFILEKRRENEIRAKRDKYIAELNDLFQRMRKDGFVVYLEDAECDTPIAHELKSCDDGKVIIDAINIF